MEEINSTIDAQNSEQSLGFTLFLLPAGTITHETDRGNAQGGKMSALPLNLVTNTKDLCTTDGKMAFGI